MSSQGTKSRADEMRERVRAKLSPTTLNRADILAELNRVHVVTNNDDLLDDEIEKILAHFASGEDVEGYALTVVGESGAGKSALIKRRLEAQPVLQPEEDEYGNIISGYLSIKTPPGCTMLSLGEYILEKTGYKLARNLRENKVWTLVRERLRAKQVFIVHLDEFQHALHAPKTKGETHLTDTIKILMQEDPSWPIWLILSGVPEVLEFIERDKRKQMRRRAPVIELPDLADSEDDLGQMSDVLELLASKCKLSVAIPLEPEFLRRMVHGGIWRFGMTIQLIKMSLESALWDDAANGELRYRHFVDGYKRISNCSDQTNVFLSERWFEIYRDVDETGKLTSALRPAKQAVKS